MMLFIKAANPLFPKILKNGPFIPQQEVAERTVGTVTIPRSYEAKDPFKWTKTEKEKVALDSHLMLIIIDSMELSIFANIASCTSAKEMMDHIEIICEGTEEVREKMRQILVTRYEAFMAQPKESITEMFERFYRLVTELQMNMKAYSTKELNLKLLLSTPNHQEQRVISLRERYFNKISYDVLYGVLKTHELELLQKRAIPANQGKMVNTLCALIVNKLI